MRTSLLFRHRLVLAAPLLLAFAANTSAAPKRESSAKVKISDSVKVGDIVTTERINRTAVGEKFRLWMSINATDCNDPALLGNGGKEDHAFELYGELRVNDKVEWKVARQNNGAAQPSLKHLDVPSSAKVDPRQQGFSLNKNPFVFDDKHEITVDTSKGRIAKIALQLFDKDNPQGGFDYEYRDQNKADRRDDKIGDYKIDLDLGALGKSDGRYYWFWNSKDESDNPIGTNLHLYAEHVGTVYASVASDGRKPEMGPKIEKKKLPNGGPGPILKKQADESASAKPRGMKLKMLCYFRVTNAMDGARDDETEIYGTVKFNGRTVWNVTRDNAFGAVRDLEKRIAVGEQTFEVLFDKPSSGVVKIDGFLNDRDVNGGDNDAMWNPSKRTVSLDIKKLLDRDARLRPFGLYVSQGDRDRESADLMIVVTKEGDIF